ncbi:S1/P1 nuclease [Croceicoccus marinus]|nr:S1/P1 nuclease [Croceicoccus marinus]
MKTRRIIRRSLCAIAAMAGALAASQPAMAWGANGHRIVGAIAQEYLSSQAHAAMLEILGSETLAEAGPWPDFMRSDPDEYWQKTASPWHYVTVPEGESYDEVGPPPQGDALTALQGFADTLRDPQSSLSDRQTALRFIVHLVGDLQQPMHVGSGDDRGGNDVKISWYGEPTNLHALWDSGLLDSQQLSYSEYAAWLNQDLTPQEMREWASPDPRAWIADSAAVRPGLYPADPDLGYEYNYKFKGLMEERLQKGGLRLAAFLNKVFAPE